MKTVFAVIIREGKRILHTRLSLWGFFIIPLLATLLFFGIYYKAYVLHVPTVVVDKDQTATSRQMTRMLNLQRYLKVESTSTDFAQAVRKIHSQKAYILIYLPSGFEKNLIKYNQPTLRSYSFGTNLLIGRLAQKAVVECVTALNKERESAQLEKMRQESVYARHTGTQPELVVHNLFNPGYNYLFYMSPAVTLSLWQMLLLLLMIPMFTKEWEKDRYSELNKTAEKRVMAVYAGKLFFPTLIMVAQYLIMQYGFFTLFHLPIHGNFWVGLIIMVLFFRSVMNLAVIISNVIRQSLFSTEIGVFLTAPAFAFSGYTFPFYEMPLFHRLFAWLMPSTHVLPVYSLFYLQKAPLSVILEESVPLFIYFVSSTLLALYVIKKNIRPGVSV